jgi:hypothetical protein
MRNMSFSMTTQAFIEHRKHVTRRLGWGFLKPGDIVMGCEKCQGLKKGEKIKKLGAIRIVDIRREPLNFIENYEMVLEGFPGMKRDEFIEHFCKHMKCGPGELVNRIAFTYIDEELWQL